MRGWRHRRYYLGTHEHAQLQCPDLACLASHGIAALDTGHPPGYSNRRGSAGYKLAYRPDRAQPALRRAGAATYLGLSRGSLSTGAVGDIFTTPPRADDRNHPNFDHGHDVGHHAGVSAGA